MRSRCFVSSTCHRIYCATNVVAQGCQSYAALIKLHVFGSHQLSRCVHDKSDMVASFARAPMHTVCNIPYWFHPWSKQSIHLPAAHGPDLNGACIYPHPTVTLLLVRHARNSNKLPAINHAFIFGFFQKGGFNVAAVHEDSPHGQIIANLAFA